MSVAIFDGASKVMAFFRSLTGPVPVAQSPASSVSIGVLNTGPIDNSTHSQTTNIYGTGGPGVGAAPAESPGTTPDRLAASRQGAAPDSQRAMEQSARPTSPLTQHVTQTQLQRARDVGPRWVSFLQGNPGSVADGAILSKEVSDNGYALAEPISLVLAEDGVTATIFAPPGSQRPPVVVWRIWSRSADEKCNVTFGSVAVVRANSTKFLLTIKIPQLPRCARSRCSGRLAYEDRAAPGPWLSNVDSQEVSWQ